MIEWTNFIVAMGMSMLSTTAGFLVGFFAGRIDRKLERKTDDR